jgi:hypothetical protein
MSSNLLGEKNKETTSHADLALHKKTNSIFFYDVLI